MENMVESGIVEMEQGLEKTQVSDEQFVQQDSPDFWEEFGEQIAAEIDKRFQSAKDKRWSELERKYGDLADLGELIPEERNNVQAQDFSKLHLSLNTFLAATGLIRNADVLDQIAQLPDGNPIEAWSGLLMDLSKMVVEVDNTLKASPGNQVLAGGKAGDSQDLQTAYQHRKAQLRPGDINALMDLKREFRQRGLNLF